MFATKVNNNTYDALVTVMAATSYEDKIDSYKKAIEIYPFDTRAYICMLEAYENEGIFGKNENDEFLALYNANKDGFDNSSAAVAELNYKIGMMYFNYYTSENGNKSFSNSVQKAYPFFAANYENTELTEDFEMKELSDCYYRICYFYKRYVFSAATVEEASKFNYEDLFGDIKVGLEAVKDAGAYDQLTFYNGTFMLLYDQRANMVSVNVEKDMIQDLLAKVYNNAKTLSVQKEQSKKLQQEIVENYEVYKEAIERIYVNSEERG